MKYLFFSEYFKVNEIFEIIQCNVTFFLVFTYLQCGSAGQLVPNLQLKELYKVEGEEDDEEDVD